MKSLRWWWWWWWWAVGTIDSTLVLRLGLDWTGLGLGLDNSRMFLSQTLNLLVESLKTFISVNFVCLERFGGRSAGDGEMLHY